MRVSLCWNFPYYPTRSKTGCYCYTTTQSKAEKLNQFFSPIWDDEIERFFKETREGKRKLNLYTTTDKETAYKSADLIIIATPTNYDDVNHFFDTSTVEDAIEWALKVNPML